MSIRHLTFLTLVLMCLALPFSRIHAWNCTGHMVVAEIAKSSLRPNALQQMEQLIDVWGKDYPESNTFITSSCWADDIKGYGLHQFDTWHFMLIPYDPENLLTEDKKELAIAVTKNNNVQWAIQQCIQSIANTNIKPHEKAMMLKFLIHFLADIHQPLHVTSLFSEKFPEGDQGGNLYTISGASQPNLHAYWDTGLGYFEEVQRPLDGNGKRLITRLAEKCMEEFPLAKAKELNLINDNVEGWAKESSEIAITTCYTLQQDVPPSPAYIKDGQEIARKRAALAGYRLAFILNAMLFQDSDIK